MICLLLLHLQIALAFYLVYMAFVTLLILALHAIALLLHRCKLKYVLLQVVKPDTSCIQYHPHQSKAE